MSDGTNGGGVPALSAAEAARRLQALGEAGAGAFTFASSCGRTVEVILLAGTAADELAALLGRFGDALSVRIFAAVTLADLPLADIAAAVGADEPTVAEQLERLEGGGFVFHLDSGGIRLFAAGNPSLKRFFAKRFAPDHRFHP